MTEQENIEFTTLLDKFIDSLDMDNMYILEKAIALQKAINE